MLKFFFTSIFLINFLFSFSQTYVHSYRGRTCVGETHTPVRLIGANFWAYDDEYPTQDLEWYANTFNESSFSEIKNSFCMNTVRLNLDFRIFESDQNPYNYLESGWTWLDAIVAAAQKAGVYLILDMHTPQGGYQSYDFSGDFWGSSANDKENQKRFKALWKEIANRYKNSAVIAGFDLINEPLPTNNSQYWVLIQQTVDEIRKVDTNHIIFVEQGFNDDFKWQTISDSNYAIDFHFYSPWEYVAQASGDVNYSYPGNGDDFWPYDYETQIEYFLEEGAQFAIDNKIPLNIGEYGIQRAVLEKQSSGAQVYLNDLYKVFEENNVGFQIWGYHCTGWGIHEPYKATLPTDNNLNTELIKSFKFCKLIDAVGFINENEVEVYPNPVLEIIFIDLPQQGNFTAQIYSIEGKLLISEKVNKNSQISVSKLEKGTYILKTSGENCEINKRFSKE